jgi:hypothetical protein
LIVAAACGTALWSGSAQADDAGIRPFQLLPTAQVTADGSSSVDVIPIRRGWGWGGYGYYGGWNRPYYSSYRGYYPYRSYYGYRYPYYSGYRYPYYYGSRYPYSYGYRGWY